MLHPPLRPRLKIFCLSKTSRFIPRPWPRPQTQENGRGLGVGLFLDPGLSLVQAGLRYNTGVTCNY